MTEIARGKVAVSSSSSVSEESLESLTLVRPRPVRCTIVVAEMAKNTAIRPTNASNFRGSNTGATVAHGDSLGVSRRADVHESRARSRLTPVAKEVSGLRGREVFRPLFQEVTKTWRGLVVATEASQRQRFAEVRFRIVAFDGQDGTKR